MQRCRGDEDRRHGREMLTRSHRPRGADHCSRRHALTRIASATAAVTAWPIVAPADATIARSAALLSDRAYLARLTTGEMAKFQFFEAPLPLATVEVRTADGQSRGLPGAPGALRLISFWASWCAPCRHEVPSLERLQARSPEIDVIAVSIDKTMEPAVRAYDSWGVKRLALHHDAGGTAAAALRVEGVPMTLLVDADGHEIGRLRGSAQWDSVEAILLMMAVSARLTDVKAVPAPKPLDK